MSDLLLRAQSIEDYFWDELHNLDYSTSDAYASNNRKLIFQDMLRLMMDMAKEIDELRALHESAMAQVNQLSAPHDPDIDLETHEVVHAPGRYAIARNKT